MPLIEDHSLASPQVAGPERRIRVLIVEDETMIGILMTDELSDLGYDVVCVAATLQEAIATITERDLDIVLLDLNLGGQDTDEVADLMNARKTPYVVCTGYTGHTDAGHPVLIKPFDLATLNLAILLELERHRRKMSGGSSTPSDDRDELRRDV